MGFTMGVPGHGLDWNDIPRDETTFAYLGNFKGGLPIRAPADSTAPPNQYVNAGAQPMDQKWHAQWKTICSTLASKIQNCHDKGDSAAARAASGSGGGGGGGGGTSSAGAANDTGSASTAESSAPAAEAAHDALSYLFSRIGFDCGRVARGLHANRVSWGTYQDEMCRRDFGEFHCNAHSNNVVLLEEDVCTTAGDTGAGAAAAGERREAFLGYLDLDMAFDEATFVYDEFSL